MPPLVQYHWSGEIVADTFKYVVPVIASVFIIFQHNSTPPFIVLSKFIVLSRTEIDGKQNQYSGGIQSDIGHP